MLLELTQINKSYGSEKVLENINLQINPRDRLGLLGVNGAGKTTLLSVIAGELDYDSGEIYRQKDLEIGYLKQTGAVSAGNTIEEEIEEVFEPIKRLGRELEELREKLSLISAGDERYGSLLEEYDRLNLIFETKEGYGIEVKANTVLTGMGFAGYNRKTRISTLSGGEKTRLSIAKLLLRTPSLLILDEPTNHLDFETLSWLEEYLRGYKGAILAVSHDRYFLDSVVNDICEIEYCKLYRYKGNYSKFAVQKKERIEYQRKQYELQQEEIAKLEDYAARNIARASTSQSAKSRLAALDRMQKIEAPPPVQKVVKISFTPSSEPYKTVLKAENLTVAVGNRENRRILFENFGIEIMKGERVAIIGKNGVGKTSLLKTLLGKIPYKGTVRWGGGVRISYFEQEMTQLDPGKTVYYELADRFPRMTPLEIRSHLGLLLFSGEDVYKRISQLSGGERARVVFAIMMLEHANVLVLDEPTNHLDYQTREILEAALCGYDGTIIMISHDRYMLNRVPTKLIEMFPDEAHTYNGGYDHYLAHRITPAKEAKKKEDSTEKIKYYRSKADRSRQVRMKTEITRIESQIAETEKEISETESEISRPESGSDYKTLSELCEKLEQLREYHSRDMEKWLELTEEYSSLYGQ